MNLSQARGVPERFQQLLSSGPLDLRNDHLIRFDVMEKDGATDLAITWLNVLFDGYGINRFLSLLSSAPTPDAFMQRINWNEEVQSPLDPPALPERLQMENDWASTMKELSQPTPGSPAGPLSNTPKRIQYEITRFSHEHSQQLDERAREEAGIISPMLFYLALSLRAHHRLFVYRNDVPERYLVPVAVDLRPQSTINPVFRNHISFLWFHAAPSELCSRTELIDRLQEQKRDQMESNFPHKMAVSLENNRYLPSGINRRMMRWQTKGELCSFFFAYTGAFFDGVDQLFGGTFIDGFPAPGVPSSPGSSFIWSHVNDQLNLTHLFQKGAVSTAERNEMKQQIEREREE